MKYIFLIFTIALFSCTSKTEDKAGAEKKALPKMEETFPFSEAERIEVTSFYFMDYRPVESNYKIENGKLPFDDKILKDRIILTRPQEERLFEILNTKTFIKDNTVADCYNPEHRITFYDQDNNVIAFLEVCLQCVGSRISPDFKVVDLHKGKMKELKEYFKSIGVKQFSEM